MASRNQLQSGIPHRRVFRRISGPGKYWIGKFDVCRITFPISGLPTAEITIADPHFERLKSVKYYIHGTRNG
jgi:hypothetical protein